MNTLTNALVIDIDVQSVHSEIPGANTGRPKYSIRFGQIFLVKLLVCFFRHISLGHNRLANQMLPLFFR